VEGALRDLVAKGLIAEIRVGQQPVSYGLHRGKLDDALRILSEAEPQ
jgi:hypothetical protein